MKLTFIFRSSDSAQLSDASDRARELGISIIAVGVSNYSRAELLVGSCLVLIVTHSTQVEFRELLHVAV